MNKRIEVYTGPDRFNRYSHARFWVTDYCAGHPEGEYVRRERGQHFFSQLPETDAPIIDKRKERNGNETLRR